MPCDGKNPNCDRRRELLAQLKCLVSSMDKKKPCEWDEPPCPPPTCCPDFSCDPPCCTPVKRCKSFEFRNSIMYRCECIKRNGLQDRCMMWDCMGRPECMTKLYPVCGPGRAALLKLTDLGDVEVALRKFYCADQAREAALAAYCRLACNQEQYCQNGNNGRSLYQNGQDSHPPRYLSSLPMTCANENLGNDSNGNGSCKVPCSTSGPPAPCPPCINFCPPTPCSMPCPPCGPCESSVPCTKGTPNLPPCPPPVPCVFCSPVPCPPPYPPPCPPPYPPPCSSPCLSLCLPSCLPPPPFCLPPCPPCIPCCPPPPCSAIC